MEKIILDTDIGCDIDDAIALTWLLRHPSCDLLGVTIVSGDVCLRARLASAICMKEKRSIPIYMGASSPLAIFKEAEFPQQSSHLGEWSHEKEFPNTHAVTFMRNAICENPGQITLVAIGPLTNIALLFSIYPETAPLVKEIYIMGGTFFEKPSLEWNIKFDPHAAHVVFSAPVPKIYTVGLNVTLQLFIGPEQSDAAFSRDGVPYLASLADDWFRDISDRIYFHDPLATGVIFDKSLCEWQTGTVHVDLDSFMTGFTADENGRHIVAKNVDVAAYFDKYFQLFQSTL